MSKAKRTARPSGQVRQSQVVRTFGPGSMLDLPNHSVLVGGLDDWQGVGEEVHEPRLAEKLRHFLDLRALKLFAPPPDGEGPGAQRTGLTAWLFPEWFITQDFSHGTAPGTRSRALVHRRRLSQGAFYGLDRKKHPVVPVRFVRACRAGHIGDIDWYYFVHREAKPCRGQLTLDERGTSGDILEITARCECGDQRRLIDAVRTERKALGACDGGRPWLGAVEREPCGETSRLLVRSASNAYFARVMSVISLPDRDEALAKAVEQAWPYLEAVESADEVRYERKKAAVKAALEGHSDEEVLRAVLARRGGEGGEAPVKSVKQAELEALCSCKEGPGSGAPQGDFYARDLPRSRWGQPHMKDVERVVLVHRLREVVAQVGFTRFEAASTDVDGELDANVRMASLAREPTWLPAVENRGEGVFIGFNKEGIEAWAERPEAVERGRNLCAGFDRWKAEHPGVSRDFPGLPFILLHSLSHLLVTAVALECGYPASSIRERVYAVKGVGYGILLYTATPDAEGTLGGLVEAGRHLARHLRSALSMAALCSNDPVCAQHAPASHLERRYLAGAACHGCLLIGETSCEWFNDFLDRALVVPTVEDDGAAFFRRPDA